MLVERWTRPAYATPEALNWLSMPQHRSTFLSPFDSLVWDRKRTERLFGFHYRLEIYSPKAKRWHGYDVLPLWAGGRIAGRADLKLDRARSTLVLHKLSFEGRATAKAEVDAALHDLRLHLGAERISRAR